MVIWDHVWLILATLGLCVVTFVTRSFFLLTPSAFVFPAFIQRALRFAPTAAITAVIAPEIFMQAGHVDVSWHNKALIACVVASVEFITDHFCGYVGVHCLATLGFWCVNFCFMASNERPLSLMV